MLPVALFIHHLILVPKIRLAAMSLNGFRATHSFDDERLSPAPTLSNRKLRAMGESVRRADGSYGEKQPQWPTIRKQEDQRLKILKRVS